jgi:RNA polymerase-binding transcription factor DksA
MPATYKELQQQLLETEQDLRMQLEATKRIVREDGVGYSNHMADAGTEVFEQARDVSVARQLERSLEDVVYALQKFEDSTYGICESCGTIIELARLEALPSARYCMRCQSRHEAKR